jgi:hypothetical protein
MAETTTTTIADMLPLAQRRKLLLMYATMARASDAAKGDLGLFIERVVQDDHGHPLRLSPIHIQWILHLKYCWSRGLKAMIMAPFGHGKSSTLAVPLIAWSLGRDPNLRIKVITNDDSSATKRVERAKALIETAAFKGIFPGIRRGRKWAGHEIYLERTGGAIDPSIHARGILTTGVGGRADIMIFDDVVDQKNSFDSTQRSKVLQFIESTWLSRLEPDARVLYIGTPWHLDDATHHLMQRPGWCTLIQRVSQGCDVIEQELIGAPDPISYPLVGGPQTAPFKLVGG